MAGEQIVSFLKANPISVACGALALAVAVGIYVRADRVPDMENLLNQKASLGERIDANLKNGAQLPDQFAAISAARQQIESRLIRPDELAKNLQFFYKLESDTGTKLVDLRQNLIIGKAPPRIKTYYIGVGFTIAVRGDYTRLLDFVRRLESNQRFCRIMTATLGVAGSSDKDRGGDVTLNLSIELLGLP
ncbi:MAG: hypothetical protein ABI222_11875 [Opitutaceae bacterium]